MGSARAAVGASGCGLPNRQRHHPSTCPACICGCPSRLHASCLAARCSTEATHALPPCSICSPGQGVLRRRLTILSPALSPHIITRGGEEAMGEEKISPRCPITTQFSQNFLVLSSALVLPLSIPTARVDAPPSLGPASGPILIRPAFLDLPWIWTQKSTLVLPASRSTPSALFVLPSAHHSYTDFPCLSFPLLSTDPAALSSYTIPSLLFFVLFCVIPALARVVPLSPPSYSLFPHPTAA